MSNPQRHSSPGPFRAEHLRDGDRYELSNGHPIYCAPAGWQHAAGSVSGAQVLDSDPDIQWTGADVGISPDSASLRAPDVAVRATPPCGNQTWLTEAPPLAVEYAGQGQDERELQDKIAELLAAGTRLVWVVRLLGPQRVEVHRPDGPMKLFTASDQLEAPGVLRNPVPVRALFDREAAHEVVLRNLLQRRGYAGLNAVLDQGREQGLEEGRELGLEEGRELGLEEGLKQGREKGREEALIEAILALLQDRGLAVTADVEARLRASHDPAHLRRWLLLAARVERAEALFAAAAGSAPTSGPVPSNGLR